MKKLTKAQANDLEQICARSELSLRLKYTRGAIEHGDLLDMDLQELLENALDENTDQRVYILKALEQIYESRI